MTEEVKPITEEAMAAARRAAQEILNAGATAEKIAEGNALIEEANRIAEGERLRKLEEQASPSFDVQMPEDDYYNHLQPNKFVAKEAATFEEKQKYSARVRARRSNMLKRLLKRFRLYQEFTAEEAAQKVGVITAEMKMYLDQEVLILGSLIHLSATSGKYVIVSAFDPNV